MNILRVSTKCQEDPDLFYSEKPEDIKSSIDICSSCPFKNKCLTQAIESKETHGVWGGRNFNKKLPSEEAHNKSLSLCRKGLHNKTEPGRCKQCTEINKKIYRKARYALESKTDAYKRKQLAKKNVLNGPCHSKKHILTPDNVKIRQYDGALMCRACSDRVKPRIIPKEVRSEGNRTRLG